MRGKYHLGSWGNKQEPAAKTQQNNGDQNYCHLAWELFQRDSNFERSLNDNVKIRRNIKSVASLEIHRITSTSSMYRLHS